MNKMTFWQVVKLLWDCDQWKICDGSMFDDTLVTKDGQIMLFSASPTYFCRKGFNKKSYEPTALTKIVISILAKRLYKKVKAREID